MASLVGGFPIPPGVASPLALQTFVGAPGGMNRTGPQHEISDMNAWTIIDAQLNDAGFIRRRGPLTELASSGASAARAIGMARTQDPAGTEQIVVLNQPSSGATAFLYGIQNTSSLTSPAWGQVCSTSPYELFDSKDALNGGCFIGSSPTYDTRSSTQTLALYRGASKNDATNIACTGFAVGAATITVTSAIASCCSGQHVFDHANGQFVGTIKSISGSVITLEFPALLTDTASVTAIDVQALRAPFPRIAVGRITCSTADATKQILGGASKFKSQGMTTAYDLYTTDYKYIGTPATVDSDSGITLVSAPAVSLNNANFIAIKRVATNTMGFTANTANTFGFLNASFAGHQFFAFGNKLRFSETTDPEAVDMTVDGTELEFSSDPIRALVPTQGALIVLTENQAYALVGAIGTTPDRWRGELIHDDGTICGMTAVSYQGGAFWAGQRGIWYFNGGSPVNIAAALDGDYRLALSTWTSASSRAYCGLVKDHLLVFIEGTKSGVFQKIKGASTTNITRPTFCIKLSDGSISILQNVELRGCLYPPDHMNLTTALLPLTTLESSTPHIRVVDGEYLFQDSGTDAYACEGGPGLGADIFVETKKYDMGDGQRLKLFRMLLLHFWTAGGNIRFDTVVGLNTAGVASTSEFWAVTAFTDKRIKFNKRTQYLALRLYQSPYTGDPANQSAANTTRVTIGSWALGFKWKRPGRV